MVKKILAKCFIYLILLLMYAPILVLIIFSFTEARSLGQWDGFSMQLYLDLFQDEKIMTAVYNTLLVALCSAVVTTIIGTLGSIGVFYSRKKPKATIKMIEQIQIATPEIVIAISLTLLFVAVGLKFNFITLLIGHVVLTIPFVILSISPKLKQMDPNMYEAAIDLGATPSQALRKVIIPEILPGILSGFMLSITLSLDDYIITAFTRNDTFETLSTYIQGVIVKSGLPASLRALTTILFLIVLVVALAINKNKSKAATKKGRH